MKPSLHSRVIFVLGQERIGVAVPVLPGAEAGRHGDGGVVKERRRVEDGSEQEGTRVKMDEDEDTKLDVSRAGRGEDEEDWLGHRPCLG